VTCPKTRRLLPKLSLLTLMYPFRAARRARHERRKGRSPDQSGADAAAVELPRDHDRDGRSVSHVAGRYLLAVGVMEGERLLERNKMLRAVAAGERPCDRLGTGVSTVMAQGCRRFRVALAGQDRADDAQAGDAGDVATKWWS
jgi:hypothetical protein